MVRTWTGQVARAAGASLLAPLVLLLAAGAVASGGGMGGFGSLGEISSGPSLPNIGLSATPGAALADADIVAADLAPPGDVAAPPAPPTGDVASADSPVSGRPGGRRAPAGFRREVSGRTLQPQARSAPGAGEAPPLTIPTAPPVRTPAPVQDLGEVTRDLGEAMRAPFEPLTNAILELLRGPPRR